jgi:nitronate monooxygenase
MTSQWPFQRLQDLLGVEHPIIQAPMAGANLSAMVIAVSEAGGLGSLPCAMLGADGVRREVTAIRSATAKPFNLNFFCHRPVDLDPVVAEAWRARLAPYYAEFGLDAATPATGPSRAPFAAAMCAVIEECRPAVVSFHFGLPDVPLLDRIRKTGAKILSSATTVAEARWLEEHGCDAIIAQSLEAGGHRGLFLTDDLSTQLPLFALLPVIVDAVKVPVIAAGGIMDGRGAAAALALGAAGVQLGTAFLFCPEATISGPYRQALRNREAHTVVTNVMSGRPARGLVTRLIRDVGPISPLAPPFPHASTAVAPLRAAAEARNSGGFSPLWAGQAFALGREMSAFELTNLIARETLAVVDRLAPTAAAPATANTFANAGMTPVGLTARWMAASRAVESDQPDPLFRDPLARALAGDDGFATRRMMGGPMARADGRDPHLSIRARFFDDALLDAVRARGARQVLMLAAGMDSRAFRLDWPPGTTLFEVDRPEIFEYKEPILARLGARARCDRRVIHADLAAGWTPSLLAAGFDPTATTAVLIEGLVMYLDEPDVRRLFDTLRPLVLAGSWLGMDIINTEMLTSPYSAGLIKMLESLGCPWKFGMASPTDFLDEYGWSATLTSPGEPEANYGIWPFPPMPQHLPNLPRTWFVRAERAHD